MVLDSRISRREVREMIRGAPYVYLSLWLLCGNMSCYTLPGIVFGTEKHTFDPPPNSETCIQ